MAAVGVPMRTVQEWMGPRDLETTQRYADYAPRADEAAMSAYMKGAELDISVTVGPGQGRAKMFTCDLTKRYIENNGDYRS